ncbi:putative HTH-type transcriptional regulator YybR [Oxobacter pfennigii]|uniref:Putative HTH-type transcriptional regulator YybR n=1 Tax=Oxobacter pfennigii TaxID=36849 RepID=A0A0P8X4D0_9CLOT|nr:helix-turn-helix domain-containing protein [Oxobacter pfennigii]KPU45645.1 putative HTH-type transcriptional regulator YybR [Oxobacter pfennigii]
MDDNLSLFGKCPVTTAQKVISGKWAIVIFYNLYSGTKRFGELQKLIPGITQAMLTSQLRSLEGYGLINRVVYPEVPPKVEYSLTEIGNKFIPVLKSLENWGSEYISYIKSEKK